MTEIPEDVMAKANAAAVLIWDEAMHDPSPAEGYAMSQAIVERIIARAILAAQEAQRERDALLSREHAAGLLSQAVNARTNGNKTQAYRFENMSLGATAAADAIIRKG